MTQMIYICEKTITNSTIFNFYIGKCFKSFHFITAPNIDLILFYRYPERYLYETMSTNTTAESIEKATLVLLDIVRILIIYVRPALCIIGIFGNAISLFIFLSKDLRKVSLNIYMSASSVSCMVFLSALLIVSLESLKINLINNEFLCPFLVFTSYVNSFLAVWSVVVTAIDYYLLTTNVEFAM